MSQFFIGVDLGGTNLRAAVVDSFNGRCLSVQRAPTPLDGSEDDLLTQMGQLIQHVIADCGLAQAEIGGVGIGVPGSIDMARGRVLLLPNVPGNWPEIPFTDRLVAMTHLPVSLLNDVRCITLAESTLGAGRGVETVVCYAIGTGIGGGSVINGKLHLGINGSAGEVGHQVVEPDGRPCKCGGQGCLEMYASGKSLRAEGLMALNHGLAPRLRELTGGDLNQASVELMVEAARDGDPDVQAIFARAGRYLGIAIGSTVAAISPNRIILSGGVAEGFDLLVCPIRNTLRERIRLVPVDQIEIVKGTLGGEAGLIGAALWAKECAR